MVLKRFTRRSSFIEEISIGRLVENTCFFIFRAEVLIIVFSTPEDVWFVIWNKHIWVFQNLPDRAICFQVIAMFTFCFSNNKAVIACWNEFKQDFFSFSLGLIGSGCLDPWMFVRVLAESVDVLSRTLIVKTIDHGNHSVKQFRALSSWVRNPDTAIDLEAFVSIRELRDGIIFLGISKSNEGKHCEGGELKH